ncbi:DUF692 domain-containing protein [Aestuariivirga sp. YIM B02566]|uniref:DUF692 domain-containing protein n=1 Tax=Taklimakanibacter albus TaxID=2800327 RepID=A0ACC5QZ33_9HYPH|nr:DUF692 domain-containing protein [Aestuariivirga sp. YIM B02566]MBK1865648.1 DUF692 domain-containing protein [Aestuariivirga sp. YIM B02566]
MKHTKLPSHAGVGFKPEHFDTITEKRQPIGFFEVHAENYMGDGGLPHAQLTRLRENYALSLHGVGLSIGSAQDLDRDHLIRLRRLCERYQPESFSEHLAWSSHDTTFLNDLLPLPYTRETLLHVAEHVDQVQETLGRQMLLENPATYLLFAESTIPETEFLAEIARRTGCGLLLDVNNVFVSATNHGLDAAAYLKAFPLTYVGEIHLSGHAVTKDETGAPLLIDTHDTQVADPVWALYESVIARTGPTASLVEWDDNIPAWPVLAREAQAAQVILDRARRPAAA